MQINYSSLLRCSLSCFHLFLSPIPLYDEGQEVQDKVDQGQRQRTESHDVAGEAEAVEVVEEASHDRSDQATYGIGGVEDT